MIQVGDGYLDITVVGDLGSWSLLLGAIATYFAVCVISFVVPLLKALPFF